MARTKFEKYAMRIMLGIFYQHPVKISSLVLLPLRLANVGILRSITRNVFPIAVVNLVLEKVLL